MINALLYRLALTFGKRLHLTKMEKEATGYLELGKQPAGVKGQSVAEASGLWCDLPSDNLIVKGTSTFLSSCTKINPTIREAKHVTRLLRI